MSISHQPHGGAAAMTASADRRLPSVSLEEVLATCRDLESEGVAVTRRSVRDRLGRGSMTTIHNGVSQFESQRAPAAPRVDLTAADREVISDLGARALAVAEERVQNILAEREAALRLAIDAAEARATDAIAAADALVADAERRALEAEAAAATALADRDAAQTAADQAERHAQRLDGQVAQLAADKAAAAAHGADLAESLTATRIRAEVEAAGREQAEARVRALETELAGIRAEYAVRKQEDADEIAKIRQSLSLEQLRLTEATEQRDAALASAEGKERELAHRVADLPAAAAAAAHAQATIAARDETIARLSAELAGERAQVQSLSAAVQASAEGLAGLHETFSSTMAAAEGRLSTRIALLHQRFDEQRDQEPSITSDK
ncbi:DNA-binding protein [Aliidongia dinghuensis]|nr:DNA-binding protein [Aliidongia dinghuensis]